MVALTPFLVYNSSMFRFNKNTLGLALSGGGTKGFAHIGAFKAFEEHNIKFDYVAGTSVGSIMGACYCSGMSAEDMVKFGSTVRDRDLLDNKLFNLGNNSGNIAKLVTKLVGDITFGQLNIPLSVVAVDLITGQEHVFSSGSVPTLCSASCAVPAIFTPVEYNDMHLVDGGLLNNIPADVVRGMGADKVVSINLNHTRSMGTEGVGLLDQLGGVWKILMSSNGLKGTLNSDIIIEPELRIFSNSTINNVEAMIAEGYRATLRAIPDILALI